MAEPIQMHYDVDGDDYVSAGSASSAVNTTQKKLGLPPETIKRVAICMYEGEINLVIHAGGGTAQADLYPDRIDITLVDHGPGIPDVDKAMQEGFSTASEAARNLGFGAGMGLPNMHKYADVMRIDSRVGQGTTVFMTIYLAS
jgi:anti-sigma regulatory factor (Ser/Thr protein kinase)